MHGRLGALLRTWLGTRLALHAWSVHWPVWAGLALLGTALLLTQGPAQIWQQQADEHLATAKQARATARLHAPAPAQPFTPAWPERARSPDRAAAITSTARRQGLSVTRLREQVDTAGHLQLGLSGTASYPALRTFVDRTLASDPAAVLDRLRLQRADAGSTDIDFDMQWTLLHQAAATRGLAR